MSQNREDRRKNKKVLNSVLVKAKVDMEKWMLGLEYIPTPKEIKAYQSGYIAGLNRGSSNKE